jgi:hypothetical protein
MKSKIKNLLDLLRDLIPETDADRRTYNNMRLIPVPVRPREQQRPGSYNGNR